MGFLQQLGRANPAQIMRTNEMHESQMEGQALNRQLTEAGLQQMRNKMAVEKQQVEMANKRLPVEQLSLGIPDWAVKPLMARADAMGFVDRSINPSGTIRAADAKSLMEQMNTDKTLGAQLLKNKLQWSNNDVRQKQEALSAAMQSGNLKKAQAAKQELSQALGIRDKVYQDISGAKSMLAFEGQSMNAQASNIVLQLHDLVASGNATPDQQRQYLLAKQLLSKDKMVTGPDGTVYQLPGVDFGQVFGGAPSQPGVGTTPQRGVGMGMPSPLKPLLEGPEKVTGVGGAPLTATEVRDQRKALDAAEGVGETLKRYSKLVDKEGWTPNLGYNAEKVAQLDAAHRATQMQLKELLNLGVLNGPDLVLMDQMLLSATDFPTDPRKWNERTKQIKMSISEVQKYVNMKKKLHLGRLGVVEKQKASNEIDKKYDELSSKYGLPSPAEDVSAEAQAIINKYSK